MAETPEIQAPQGGALAVTRSSANNLKAYQGGVLGIYNVPADAIRSTYAGINLVQRKPAPNVKVAQASIIAVIKSVIDTPRVIAWTYTLDGHDYYVLKLGTTRKTLVCDLATKNWMWWTSGSRSSWRASCGMNWVGSGTIPQNYGSDVIVGDDTTGVLWVLDPEQPYDESQWADSDPITFPRVATGWAPGTGRKFEPVYSVDLRGSLGSPYSGSPNVTLSYSDDSGNTYVTADEPIVVEPGNYNQDLTWFSMGRFAAPGRIFRIEDDGALARIDSMDVNE